MTLNYKAITNLSHPIDQQFGKCYTKKVYDRFS